METTDDFLGRSPMHDFWDQAHELGRRAGLLEAAAVVGALADVEPAIHDTTPSLTDPSVLIRRINAVAAIEALVDRHEPAAEGSLRPTSGPTADVIGTSVPGQETA